MKKASLVNLIIGGTTKNIVRDFEVQTNFFSFKVKEVIDAAFHEKHEIAFHSAWILERIYLQKIDEFLPQATYFLDRFSEQIDPSAQRHFAKLLSLMTDKKASIEIKIIVYNYDFEKLVETLFSWLIGKVAVAVKVYCVSALANLSAKHTWVKEELLQTIDYLTDKESIAFYARAKKVRKQLEI